ncbi:hypothetical protein EYC84_006724 [Monilinia fructicola]|uniref:HAMP domain-containing protein n=1 Tax=Monilinia fructicola TaxID=38448 RepID=A0A5M9KCG6_MONFR|nr:hypothetical protein EYC84_006724 [Monilinia fructicola]
MFMATKGLDYQVQIQQGNLHSERELAALVSRVQRLEAKAITVNNQALPDTPNEIGAPSAFADVLTGAPSRASKSTTSRQQLVNSLLAAREAPTGGERPPKFTKLSDEELEALREHVDDQSKQLDSQKSSWPVYMLNCLSRSRGKKQALNVLEVERKALREIGEIVTAVARGDLSKKVQIHSVEMDPEITTFKRVINTMMDQLQIFSSEVSRVAREVGTEGILGDKPRFLELTSNVMAQNLTDKCEKLRPSLQLSLTEISHKRLKDLLRARYSNYNKLLIPWWINLELSPRRVTRVARDVGTEGILGGQAEIEGVQALRDIAIVTTAVAKGDLTQKVQAECKGEIKQLKETINSMVDQLQQFAREVTKIAREVGTEGRLGGQATVHDVKYERSQRLLPVARGDLTKKIEVEVQGEIASLKDTINTHGGQTWKVERPNRKCEHDGQKFDDSSTRYIDCYAAIANGDMSQKIEMSIFSNEVQRVAKDVGVDGKMGGQADVAGSVAVEKRSQRMSIQWPIT